jgi:hypothetical protein
MSVWSTTSRVYDPETKTFVVVKVDLDIQWQKVADILANKAINNKSHRSSLVEGKIRATITGEVK